MVLWDWMAAGPGGTKTSFYTSELPASTSHVPRSQTSLYDILFGAEDWAQGSLHRHCLVSYVPVISSTTLQCDPPCFTSAILGSHILPKLGAVMLTSKSQLFKRLQQESEVSLSNTAILPTPWHQDSATCLVRILTNEHIIASHFCIMRLSGILLNVSPHMHALISI